MAEIGAIPGGGEAKADFSCGGVGDTTGGIASGGRAVRSFGGVSVGTGIDAAAFDGDMGDR